MPEIKFSKPYSCRFPEPIEEWINSQGHPSESFSSKLNGILWDLFAQKKKPRLQDKQKIGALRK